MQAYVAVPDFVEDPDSWRTVIDDKGNGRIQFTVLGYLMAGAPGELSLYEKGASTSEGPAATVSFTMEDLVQRVDIGVSGPSLEEILGSYSGETDVLAMRVSDAGYEAYVNESEGDKVASRAECDAVLTELMQEEALTVSSITISSDDPASGRCTILVDVINTKGEPTPVSVEGTYKTGMLIVQGEHGESTIVVTKEPDGAIRLKSSETQLGLCPEIRHDRLLPHCVARYCEDGLTCCLHHPARLSRADLLCLRRPCGSCCDGAGILEPP